MDGRWHPLLVWWLSHRPAADRRPRRQSSQAADCVPQSREALSDWLPPPPPLLLLLRYHCTCAGGNRGDVCTHTPAGVAVQHLTCTEIDEPHAPKATMSCAGTCWSRRPVARRRCCGTPHCGSRRRSGPTTPTCMWRCAICKSCISFMIGLNFTDGTMLPFCLVHCRARLRSSAHQPIAHLLVLKRIHSSKHLLPTCYCGCMFWWSL